MAACHQTFSFKSLLLNGGGRKTLKTFVLITSKNSASGIKIQNNKNEISRDYSLTILLKVDRMLAYKYNPLKKSFKEIVLIACCLYIEVQLCYCYKKVRTIHCNFAVNLILLLLNAS